MKSNMTIPSRPAPAPPTQNSNAQFSAQPSRYAPTTNWDDSPFTAPTAGGNAAAQSTRVKKPPPPRPPPPKVSQSTSLPALKKPVQSVNILSNIFGSSKSKQNHRAGQTTVPPKLPAPPPTNHHHHNRYQSTGFTQPAAVAPSQSDQQLISFDSPPDSPTLTQKSNPNSDCLSIDSFSSDSNYSSPHNESASQAESGFEDDFSVQSRSSSAGPRPWEVADPFSLPPQKLPNPPKAMPKPAPVSAKPKSLAMSFFGKSAAKPPPDDEFDDPLCNGKPIMKGPAPGPRVPTIIKVLPPGYVAKAKPAPKPEPSNYSILSDAFAQQSLDDSLPEPPMPSIPPPPPPPAEYLEALDDLNVEASETESYGIALYDYSSDQVDDLNFKANEKIYLVRQINDEWLFGRNRRGCEGMFPANFVDVKIPIRSSSSVGAQAAGVMKPTTSTSSASTVVRVLYDFNAETMDDLTIKENEMITVMYQLNAEWLYGRNQSNMFGQFPANFIEFVPPNLPSMP